jgi:expansin (peptidoglycan-binding protein)
MGGTPALGGKGANTGGSGVAGTVAIGTIRTGEGTYYGATGDGNCSFGPSPNDLMVAALNQTDYAMAAWCDACADVTGPIGKVRVRIVDRCPECQPGDLDFSQEAFALIALVEAGRVPISWTFVACDVIGPVSYRFKEGSSPYWTALQVLNHRLPITQLDFSSDGGSTWNPTVRQEYNYFLAASGFGVLPVRVRITATDGQTLIDQLPLPASELVVQGQAQFQ